MPIGAYTIQNNIAMTYFDFYFWIFLANIFFSASNAEHMPDIATLLLSHIFGIIKWKYSISAVKLLTHIPFGSAKYRRENLFH